MCPPLMSRTLAMPSVGTSAGRRESTAASGCQRRTPPKRQKKWLRVPFAAIMRSWGAVRTWGCRNAKQARRRRARRGGTWLSG